MSPRQAASANQDHVLGCIEEHTVCRPEAIAAECETRRLTYQELKQKSDRVAANLAGLGVGRGSLVAVYLNRSIEYVLAVTGILKAGAAYLPLDPSLPQKRVDFMLDDSGTAMTITEEEFLPKFAARRALLVGELLETAPEQLDAPSSGPNPDDLAYVIYTSGSTGQPKGVEILHRGLSLILRSIAHELEIGPDDTLLAVTSLSFDVAVLELLLPLTSGARLALMPQARLMLASVLEEAIRKYDPAIICGTPSLWRLLIEGGWQGSRKLQAITGGEPLDVNLAASLLQRTRALWNHYGPTEITILATSCRVRADDLPSPIGYRLPHIRPFVVDSEGRSVEAGQVGEMLLGGESLARGYRNRLELTSSRFVEFESAPGRIERVYRTGDLVRQRPDGAFEFAGRIDHQVKVRGFRIELEEIEAALNQYPDVLESAVIVLEETPHDKSLVAYCRMAPGKNEAAGAIRSYLVERLPAYMLPSRFVTVERLPLTASGKIDRLELTRREAAIGDEPGFVSDSADPVALELANIWRRLLRLRNVNLDDNFFELGGHSMLAARLFDEISSRFHKDLPLSTLFEAPTVLSLAKAVSHPKPPAWSPLVEIRSGAAIPFFCVHPIGGNVLIFKNLSDQMPHRPFYGLQAKGLSKQERPHTSVEKMAAEYVTHVRSVQPSGPYFLGGYSAGGLVAFEMARLLQSAGEKVELLVLFDSFFHSQSLPERFRVPAGPSLLLRPLRAIRRRINHLRTAPPKRRFEFVIRDLARWQSTIKLMAFDRTKRWQWNPFPLDAFSGFLYAIRNYTPKPLSVKTILFLADENAADAAFNLPSVWRGLIQGPLDVRRLAIEHDRLLEAPFAATVAAIIDQCIEDCLAVE